MISSFSITHGRIISNISTLSWIYWGTSFAGQRMQAIFCANLCLVIGVHYWLGRDPTKWYQSQILGHLDRSYQHVDSQKLYPRWHQFLSQVHCHFFSAGLPSPPLFKSIGFCLHPCYSVEVLVSERCSLFCSRASFTGSPTSFWEWVEYLSNCH